jgi:two-component system response regulator TctD
MRLLLVEDNVELAHLIAKGLRGAGFEVDLSVTLASATEALSVNPYASIILDLGLPDGDGASLLHAMRARGNSTPVLVLTARGTVGDRVAGLREGADDYLVKPFAFEELVARIQALLRRPATFLGSPIRAGNVAFDAIGRQVYVNGRPQLLSARELALLEILIGRVGRVVQKEFVESHLFGLSDELRSNAVEVYVHRLRKQLIDVGATIEIRTIRGVGYLMTEVEP